MRNSDKNNRITETSNGLLGSPTPAKASGAAFTLASIIPTLLAVIFVVALGALGLTGEENTEKNWYTYANMLLIQLSFVIVAAWYFYWTKKPLKTALKEQKCHPKYFFWAILLQFGLMALSELNTFFLSLLGNIGYADSSMAALERLMETSSFIGVLFVVAVLPAILEEIIFRGVLLKGLRAFGTTGEVLICGALFSLYHQNPAQTIYQFCCGAAFALVAVRSGSILPTMLSHFINNALILALQKLKITSFTTPVFRTLIAIFSVCLILSLIYLIFIDKSGACTQRTEKNETKTERKYFWRFAAVGVIVCAVSWLTMLISGIAGT